MAIGLGVKIVFGALALGVVAAMAKKKPTTAEQQQNDAMAEAPVDARNMLAVVLSPSLSDIDTLNTYLSQFKAAYANAAARADNKQAFRLNQFALATTMKIQALQAGKTPDSNALLTVATAAAPALDTTSNLTAAQQTAMAQAPVDANNMLALVLTPSYVDANQISNYADQFKAAAQNAVGRADQVQAFRLVRYAAAAKMKSDALKAGQASPDTQVLLETALAPFGLASTTTTSAAA